MDAQTAWETHSQDVDRFIASRLEDKAIVQDILHDVYLKVQAKFDQLQDPKKYKSWVLKIAQNTVMDHYRHRLEVLSLENEAGIPDDVDSIDAWEKISACVIPFIEELDEGYREALLLSAVQGHDDKEVARRMGLSLSATKSRIARGKKMLKEKFDTCHIFNLGPRHASIESDTFGQEVRERDDERAAQERVEEHPQEPGDGGCGEQSS